ncbi:hypothetical protein IR145_03690, partial [Streptococcus danieliae]|nr:hypothetical protein [Streptococcus danieliae]
VVFHKNNSTFASIGKGVYSDESKLEELEANIGASLLMANDSIIEELLERKYTFVEMCNTLEMSRKALHTRLINYVQYDLEFSNNVAKNIVYQFRYGINLNLFEIYEESKIRLFIKELIDNTSF